MNVTLFSVSDDVAKEALAYINQVPSVTVQQVHCHPMLSEWYRCPFLKIDSGRAYFGLSGIQNFVEEHRHPVASY